MMDFFEGKNKVLKPPPFFYNCVKSKINLPHIGQIIIELFYYLLRYIGDEIMVLYLTPRLEAIFNFKQNILRNEPLHDDYVTRFFWSWL